MLTQLCTETTVVSRRGSTVFVDLQGSPFFVARGESGEPSYGFYESAIVTFFGLCRVDAAVRPGKSRTPGANSCLLLVLTDKARAAAAKGTVLGLARGESVLPVPQPVRPAPPEEDQAPVAPSPVPEVAEAEAAAPLPEEPEPIEELDGVEIEMRWDAITTIPQTHTSSSAFHGMRRDDAASETVADVSEWERL
jgi:hypothetical protein